MLTKKNQDAADAQDGDTCQANLTGNGAIAQGGGTAVGAGGVHVGGQNSGNINTGAQTNVNSGGAAVTFGGVDTGGGDFIGRDKITHGIMPQDLGILFAPLLAAIAQQAPAGGQAAAVEKVEQLKAEVAKGEKAEDGKIARIIDGLADLVPNAVGAVVSLFATPILGGIAGPVTKYVLEKLK